MENKMTDNLDNNLIGNNPKLNTQQKIKEGRKILNEVNEDIEYDKSMIDHFKSMRKYNIFSIMLLSVLTIFVTYAYIHSTIIFGSNLGLLIVLAVTLLMLIIKTFTFVDWDNRLSRRRSELRDNIRMRDATNKFLFNLESPYYTGLIKADLKQKAIKNKVEKKSIPVIQVKSKHKGRPKGAKNKPKNIVKAKVQTKVKKKGGRPKGAKNKPKNVIKNITIKPVKHIKKRKAGRPKGAKNKKK